MTSNHHAPYGLGYTRATMAQTEGGEAVRRSKPQKWRPSSDCSLQSELGQLLGVCSMSPFCFPLYVCHCSTCVAQVIRGMMI